MGNTNEQKYLNFGKKLCFGVGDLGNAFGINIVTAFMLIYLTDTVGLNAGIIGTLMMISRILDGITDIAAGTIIDRTRHKWGKARTWMIRTIIPMGVCEILLFMVPGMDKVLQYAYFFILYTIMNDFLFTMNNIAYSTLPVLITKNKNEIVQIGPIRFIGSTIGGVLVSAATFQLVQVFGGGTTGWRTVAIVYALIFIMFQSICILAVKELPQEIVQQKNENALKEFMINIKYLLKNKYFLNMLFLMILTTVSSAVSGTIGIYYMTYVLGNAALLGIFSGMSACTILGLIFTPLLVKKLKLQKTIFLAFFLKTLALIGLVFAANVGNLTIMLICYALSSLFLGPFAGCTTVLIAETSGYTLRKDQISIEATMFSANSMATKIGNALGSAVCGWLLAAAGYVGSLKTQSDSAVSMIGFLYIILPLLINIVLTILAKFQNVERANEEWDKQHSVE